MTAFSGEFADLKLIKTRSVVQMVIELPIEAFAPLVAHFGPPGKDTWVALARLTASPDELKVKAREEGSAAVKAAALRCKDPRFQRWILGDAFSEHNPEWNEADTVARLRSTLGIDSRTELLDSGRRLQWQMLVASYERETKEIPA